MPGQEFTIAVPGRVNLIGEHVDYHGLPVLPVAIARRVRVVFHPREDRRIRAASQGFGPREFEWTGRLAPAAPGDWENYVRAAAQTVGAKWGVGRGVDATVTSDLPPAAGLSSSSAVLIAFTLGLLRANGCRPGFEELMEVLPEGEQFVGTRGGAMDHAACLGSRTGCASLIEFEPLALRHIPVPQDWAFLVAHSLTTSEKSGAVREAFNARRRAGAAALKRLGLPAYRNTRIPVDLSPLAQDEREAFLHVTSEAARVTQAVDAMGASDIGRFGRLMCESHASLRDRLKVSCPALDRLVEAACASGAAGARLTGAGFGGCAVICCRKDRVDAVRRGLVERYYTGNSESYIIDAAPAAGALLQPEST